MVHLQHRKNTGLDHRMYRGPLFTVVGAYCSRGREQVCTYLVHTIGIENVS